jgi:hypothetical protein
VQHEGVAEIVCGPASRPKRGPDDTLSLFMLTNAEGVTRRGSPRATP